MKPQPLTLNPQRVLLLMRHAKTESTYTLKHDVDRVLTKKGEMDARQMGLWLKSKEITIDRIISSPAQRTRQTAEGVREANELSPSIIEYREPLYHATPEIFQQVIRSIPDSITTALIISHNDGITRFANQLTNTRIDHMQPGSVFAIKCQCENWADCQESDREFLFYKQPQ